jgi:hypothetical protein
VSDATAWMPPELPEEQKRLYLLEYPDNPHGAAAAAWEDWAGTLPVSAPVLSASTGAQSASYGDGGSSPFQIAQSRARWHRARAKAKAVDVALLGNPNPDLGGDAA